MTKVALDPRWSTVLTGADAESAMRLQPALTPHERRDVHVVARALGAMGHLTASFWGPVVVLDLLLGLSLMWAGYPLTATLPGSVAFAAGLVVVAAFRRPTLTVRGGGLLLAMAVGMLGYLVAVSVINGQPWTQRIEKFALFVLLAAALATGRVNIRSLVVGGCLGALVNVPLFYLGLAPNNYPPFLTGFYGDKNVAGLYYAVWGALGLLVWRGKTAVLWVLTSGVFLFLTGSRTSMAAYIGALGWFVLRNRVGVAYRVVIGAIGLVTLLWAVDNLAESSAFGDRTGTDWYRHQIEIAMAAKVAITPWYGLGLNQGTVVIGQRPQYFHDSYSQAFVEGGYLNLWVVVGVFVLIGAGVLDRRLHISRELLAVESAMIALLVCAWKLGETLMTTAGFLVLGIALAYRLGSLRSTPDEAFRRSKRTGPVAWSLDAASAPLAVVAGTRQNIDRSESRGGQQ